MQRGRRKVAERFRRFARKNARGALQIYHGLSQQLSFAPDLRLSD